MSYTISNVEDDLSGILHGKTVNKVTNIRSAERRAAQNLLAQIDPDETRRITTLTIYDGVTDYNAPSDLKEKRIVDVRPQVNRNLQDNFSNRLSKDFDRKVWGNWLTVMDDGGTKYLRIKATLTPAAQSVDPMDDTTHWVASGDASSLTTDDLYSVTNGTSLKFNLAAAGSSGILTNSAIDSMDLTDWLNTSSFFVSVYLQSATAITGVTLRIGSSSTKYWEMTGVLHRGSLKAGWNLYRFDWSGVSPTGIPTVSALTYARLAFAYGGSATVIRVDKLFTSLPKIYDLEYYSKFLFSASSTWVETPVDGDTVVNLDTASYNIYTYEVALAALQQIQGKDALADRNYFFKQLYGDAQAEGLYKLYKMNNPSQAEKPTQTYYGNTGWRRSGGREGGIVIK
jgi:hypothetical protein